jgi:conjugal transfer pilus assembly protein TraL
MTKIPRTLDQPITLLLWSADELVPFCAVVVIGMLMGQFLIALVVALGVTRAYRRFRDIHPDGYLFHLAYWYGFMPISSRHFPNPFIRTFYP